MQNLSLRTQSPHCAANLHTTLACKIRYDIREHYKEFESDAMRRRYSRIRRFSLSMLRAFNARAIAIAAARPATHPRMTSMMWRL